MGALRGRGGALSVWRVREDRREEGVRREEGTREMVQWRGVKAVVGFLESPGR